MPTYLIFQGEVLDPEAYEEYKTGAAASIEAAGGRYLVRGGEVHVLDGPPPVGRTVVVEFPTRQAALDWFHGDDYAVVRSIRERAARTDQLILVDGV